MNKKTFYLTLLFFIGLISGLFIFLKAPRDNNISHDIDEKYQILVSILPQKQIVERIIGDDSFIVDVIIPPGFSPATYDPTTQDIQKVSQAKMYFRIGKISFEEVNIKKLSEINKEMIVVDTSVNNQFRMIEEHSHDGDENHSADEVSDAELDPHVWLSPQMVKKQAEVIYNSLVEYYPEKAAGFTENYKQLEADLDSLDEELKVAFAPIKGKTMLVYHPAFGYLARDYDFNQEYIEIEGQEPSITQLQMIINEAKNDGVRVIFVQKQFSQDSAKAIADNIDGIVVEVDPLDPDYFNNLRTIASKISEALVLHNN